MSERAEPSVPAPHHERSSVKETLTSIIIAFVLAFVFRAFVIEAFVIPTGSMAPTLMGEHMRVNSPISGDEWAVGPWSYDAGRTGATAVQTGPNGRGLTVTDPMSGVAIDLPPQARRMGDRILVLKYLYSIYDPQRWDVVVFKSPPEPQTNYIKRLIALPNEQVALIDGDVFIRDAAEGAIPEGADGWSLPGWRIARKPERVQRTAWQPVFNSLYTPAQGPSLPRFTPPWEPATPGWDTSGVTYRYEGTGATGLGWNNQRWPITDRYPYNETPEHHGVSRFPVSDLALSAGIEPEADGLLAIATVRARGFDFKAEIAPDGVTLSAKPLLPPPPGTPGPAEPVRVSTDEPLLRAGRITNIEFWHSDQALSLYADGELIASLPYDWTPTQRLRQAIGLTPEEVVAQDERSGGRTLLADPRAYHEARVQWEFAGGPFRLHRVGLARDIFYQPAVFTLTGHSRQEQPAAATHPQSVVTLGPDHFFVLGDNSPASSDARAWDDPDPWVSATIDDTPNVVHRDLLIGRAFFVYFPSLLTGKESRIPVPDFGRMRWIW